MKRWLIRILIAYLAWFLWLQWRMHTMAEDILRRLDEMLQKGG